MKRSERMLRAKAKRLIGLKEAETRHAARPPKPEQPGPMPKINVASVRYSDAMARYCKEMVIWVARNAAI